MDGFDGAGLSQVLRVQGTMSVGKHKYADNDDMSISNPSKSQWKLLQTVTTNSAVNSIDINTDNMRYFDEIKIYIEGLKPAGNANVLFTTSIDYGSSVQSASYLVYDEDDAIDGSKGFSTHIPISAAQVASIYTVDAVITLDNFGTLREFKSSLGRNTTDGQSNSSTTARIKMSAEESFNFFRIFLDAGGGVQIDGANSNVTTRVYGR